MSFFEELKRRNVFRVGIAYTVTAWLLMQASDLVFPRIGLPDSAVTLVIALLGIGFIPALIFAWAFELTPEGIKKEKDVDRSQSITPQTGRKLDYTIIAVLLLALAYFVYDKFVLTGSENHFQTAIQKTSEVPGENGSLTPVETSAKSIAVLPFVNMSDDASNEYFSDGISEEILNALAKVKELKVAGRTSSFAFKGHNEDLRQIGETLGVNHILEGSVRKSGSKVRITAQLIQVDDGFHAWSETYDRELTDVFEIQDEIATAILEQLKAALMGDESKPALVATARTDSEVYDQYLLARQRIYERTRFSIESAVELLDKAIARDPGYAPAYAQRGIAALLLSDRSYGETTEAEAESQAKLYLDKALQLDPDLSEGWAGMGLYHGNRPGEGLQSIEALQKALAINPNLIDASNWLQIEYSDTGDNVQAMQILEGMVERDPLYPPGFGNAVQTYNLFGQQEKSWALIERIRPFLPGNPQLLQAEGVTWLSLGKPAKSVPLLESAQKLQPSDAIIRAWLSNGLMQTGQYERVAAEGDPRFKAQALVLLNRPEEALGIARKLAGEGDPGPLIVLLDQTGQQKQLVEFIESRWPDLAAFEHENPDSGTGYGRMLSIARAYAAAGNETRFNDAMARIRAAHDRSIAQGIADQFFMADEARYYLLSGDPEQAIDRLTRGVDSGWVFPVRLTTLWPEMKALSGDPRFEALQARMLEKANAERAELGLEPLST